MFYAMINVCTPRHIYKTACSGCSMMILQWKNLKHNLTCRMMWREILGFHVISRYKFRSDEEKLSRSSSKSLVTCSKQLQSLFMEKSIENLCALLIIQWMYLVCCSYISPMGLCSKILNFNFVFHVFVATLPMCVVSKRYQWNWKHFTSERLFSISSLIARRC